ncbi:MAG: EamA family transporter RarD [Actinomycetales bacterium]|nr:EamA family transporter RarD [Actinomycetales bacterium]
MRRGTFQGAAAYVLWGLFPVYWYALMPAGPIEIIGHRIGWTLLFCLALLAVRREWAWLRTLTPRRVAGVAVAAIALAVNWFVYVLSVQQGQTNEAALGYFLNPLITVALGVVVLGERLRRLQVVAVGVGGLAAAYLTLTSGKVPILALTVAVTFALYGLIKKRLGVSMEALPGFTVETAVLVPASAALLLMLHTGTVPAWLLGGQAMPSPTFLAQGGWHTLLIVLIGPITALPLLLFAAATRRIPLVTVGLLQFLAPVLQLIVGLAFGEQVSATRWIGFAVVWVALALLTVDAVRSRRAIRTASQSPSPRA